MLLHRRYDGQAQRFTNTFKMTPQGKIPRFKRWSDLFDIDRLRTAGVDVVEYHEAGFERIDRAILQTGIAGGRAAGESTPDGRASADALSGTLVEKACKAGRDGLQANFTWSPPTERAGGVAVAATQNAMGLLYERHLTIGTLRCGSMALRQADVVQALNAWLGESRVAAVFDVGHHSHTLLSDTPTTLLLASHLRPNLELWHEAARAIEEDLLPRAGSSQAVEREAGGRDTSANEPRRLVAIHWRHGDYVDYKLLSPMGGLVRRIHSVLEELEWAPAPRDARLLATAAAPHVASAHTMMSPRRRAPSVRHAAHDSRTGAPHTRALSS